jgi:hypothetical protein
MPRAAVIAALKSHGGSIEADFRLTGRLDDPSFSVAQGLKAQIGLGIAAALGVSVLGVAEGVGKLGVEGARAVGKAVTRDKK